MGTLFSSNNVICYVIKKIVMGKIYENLCHVCDVEVARERDLNMVRLGGQRCCLPWIILF